MTTIAYLATEIPGLSETFVYAELLGLEKRGFCVVPISLRRPAVAAPEQPGLAERTLCIYDVPAAAIVLRGAAGLVAFGAAAPKAIRWLLQDMMEVGLARLDSWKLVFQFFAAVKLAGFLRSRGCRHLHAHFAHTPAQLAMYASVLTGIPFTVTAHANDIFERGLLLRRKAERAARMLTVSEHNRHHLENLGIPAHRLAVVRCGVSLAARGKQVAAFEGRAFRIGTLGRMVEKKGFDVLLRAVAHLRDAGHALELRVAGDGPLRTELLRLAADLRIEDVVRFDGRLAHDRVGDWMQRLDAFVLACRRSANGDMDGIPVVLMEAMSQSVPVVSTRLSGIPELVVHQETGLLAEPADHLDLALQIGCLIASTELRAALAARAREHVANEFGQALNLDRLIDSLGLETAAVA